MSSAAIAVQTAIRRRLIGSPYVNLLVPAASILDTHARPTPDPAIILGEAQEVEDGDMARTRVRVFHTIHVWKREPSLEGVTIIAGAIRAAVHTHRLKLGDPFTCIGSRVTGIRTMRDPGAEWSHAVVTVEAVAEEALGEPPAFEWWRGGLDDFNAPGFVFERAGEVAVLFTEGTPAVAEFAPVGSLDAFLAGALPVNFFMFPPEQAEVFRYIGPNDSVLILFSAPSTTAPAIAGFEVVP